MNVQERQAVVKTLEDDIVGYDGLIADERDAKRKLDWIERRNKARDDLRRLLRGQEANAILEYDQLMQMIYEVRADVAIIKRQFDDHLKTCGENGAGFPPSFLIFLAVGGVVTLLVLVFIVFQIGMLG